MNKKKLYKQVIQTEPFYMLFLFRFSLFRQSLVSVAVCIV